MCWWVGSEITKFSKVPNNMERKLLSVRGFHVQGYRRKKYNNRSFSASSRFDKWSLTIDAVGSAFCSPLLELTYLSVVHKALRSVPAEALKNTRSNPGRHAMIGNLRLKQEAVNLTISVQRCQRMLWNLSIPSSNERESRRERCTPEDSFLPAPSSRQSAVPFRKLSTLHSCRLLRGWGTPGTGRRGAKNDE